MLIIKFLIGLAILLAMFGLPGVGSDSISDSISDKTTETVLAIVDNSILAYYVNHGGLLPYSLNEQTKVAMGLEDVDLSQFIYVKVDDNTFRLTARLSNSTLTSVNSDKELIEIEPVAQ